MAVHEAAVALAPHGAPGTRVGQRVRVPKTAELVAASLRRRIVRGELVEGDALPPEATLMAQFGVSRPTLREAFRVLESEALISVRRGAHGGARVHTPNGDIAARYAALVLEHRGTTIADIYQARAVIEPQCVAMLARNHTRSDLARLGAAVRDCEATVGDPVLREQANLAFRVLLVDLAGNTTLAVLSGMLRHMVDLANLPTPLLFDNAHGVGAATADAVLRAHRQVVELIEAGKADDAEDLWRSHMRVTGEYLTTGAAATTTLDLLG
jgi:DNA-binding FadR family transcriptional regulator